jgi:histidine ammonia-lyase
MVPQYTAAALVSENKILSHPASVDSIPTSAGQEDHVSMGTIGARKAAVIADHLSRVLGIEWMCAAQAIDLQPGLHLGKGTREAYMLLREHVSFMEKDRAFYKDQETSSVLIREGSLVERVGRKTSRLE